MKSVSGVDISSFKEIWFAIGPLVGVLLGAWLNRMWQRGSWKMDNKKQEYRELLGTLVNCIREIQRARAPNSGENPYKAQLEGYRVTADRLFIANVLKTGSIKEDWDRVVQISDRPDRSERAADIQPYSLIDLNREFNRMFDKILGLARKDLGIT